MRKEIFELIPQRPPFVMVDAFLGLSEGVSRTLLCVPEENVLVEEGEFTECGLIEHIAQSAAARVGHICLSRGEAVRIGYIGSVNNFSATMRPKVGDTVETTVEVLQEVLNITLIQARCQVNGVQVAECRMKIFLTEE